MKQIGLKETVARNLRAFRLESGLTQQQVADRAKYNVTYYARLENDPQNISLGGLERLAHALNREVSELVSGEKHPFKEDVKNHVLEALRLLQIVEAKIY